MELYGEFFTQKKNEYDENTINCAIESLQTLESIGDKPLMMLGKIQSGKTKAFIGVIALAFDNGYDLAVVLTKNSNALARQTVARLKKEFSSFREDELVDIFDIMCMPENMNKFELDKKLILVVKKEKNNLPKLKSFIQDYGLSDKKQCLIIDDEADFCSIGYEKRKETDDFDLRKIASLINELRLQLTCKFIQVTATPYSLYLQPQNIVVSQNKIISAVKPAATVLVPHGSEYIGGDFYFSSEINDKCDLLFYAIERDEILTIKQPDRRKLKLEDVLVSKKVVGLRKAIMNFIVGGCIRIIQNGGNPRGKKNKFSFILHTEISKASHFNQESIISAILDELTVEVKRNGKILRDLLMESYEELGKSVESYGFNLPEYDLVESYVHKAIIDEWISRTIVNSENDINALLDEDGQLKLRTPFNIFIGGQILDRGITINNLIGFYYGRMPQKMQQDTVLQHARMYGYRRMEDMAVTRLYTTKELYQKLHQINEFDSKLRDDFIEGNFKEGIIFISRDQDGHIIPCSPAKIALSDTQVLRAGKTLTPVGFQTGYKTRIQKYITQIDSILKRNNNNKLEGIYKISLEDATNIINIIYQTIELESEDCVNCNTFTSVLKYLSHDVVNIYCGTKRNISRLRKTSRYYSDMPYNRDHDLAQAKNVAINNPTLMLMKQEGKVELGWKGAEFYWPVLVTQKNIKTAVYSSKVL